VQWEPSPIWRVGALLRFPAIRIESSGEMAFDRVRVVGQDSSSTFFRDGDATFTFPSVVAVDLGLGLRLKKVSLEADVRLQSGGGREAIFRSSQLVTEVTTTGSDTVTQQTPFPDLTYKPRFVTNVAVGGAVQVGEGWAVHAGFFTDLSPVGSQSDLIFTKVNIFGVTAGVSFTIGPLSGSLGGAFSWGHSSSQLLGQELSTQAVSTGLTVHAFSILYSGSVMLD